MPRPLTGSVREFLGGVPPLSRLSAPELDRLAAASRRVRMAKGETVFSEGDRADGVWVVQTGRLEVMKYTSSGRPMAIESLTTGDIAGTLCRVGAGREVYPCTAVAATDSALICIPENYFWPLFQSSPAVAGGVCSLCSQRLSAMREFAATTQERADRRVISVLLRLSDVHGDTLPFSKREISELAATAPETAVRIMNALERKQWIASSRGRITLRNIPQLRASMNGMI